jgi:hypothetical protein
MAMAMKGENHLLNRMREDGGPPCPASAGARILNLGLA